MKTTIPELSFSSNINEQDRLYRYISLAQFLSLVENEKLFLNKITSWDDPWEGLDKQIPMKNENGNLEYAHFTLADSVVGQCWTTEKDSDAMWRIYSPNKQGIMLETKARNFKCVRDLKGALLAKVKYFNNENFLAKRQELTEDKSYVYAGTMVMKRDAFKHENEVRLLVCMQAYRDENIKPWDTKTCGFKVNPYDFIESITLDPRAEQWFVDTIKKYCAAKGFICPVTKSKLYQSTFFEDTKLTISYVPIKNDSLIKELKVTEE